MVTPPFLPMACRCFNPRPIRAFCPTKPPYECTTKTISLPSSAIFSKVERSAAASSARPLLGGSAPTEGYATASVSHPRWCSCSRVMSKQSGVCQAPGANTMIGLDMLTVLLIWN
ncbi:hypothetical protein IG631_06747 [Alternaria alternata]|nr:hypothetical protein IG631_06747 [Alternaria alternata]